VIGNELGPYRVLKKLGAGGMGEVYRATDTNLGRDVAIKVLPEAFAQDPERIARFEREAKTLASLSHPNIAIIHGLEKSHGTYALVMELVEGEDLSERIARGPIPIDEALPIAEQIAEALEAAHEQGIIHRDLKPANVKVRPDGTVKVLDFGLAKLTETAASGTGAPGGPAVLSMSPTITSPALMTGVGVLLGTAAYMSPEQAKGRAADKRSDIWAFGCVLYEMLTGKRAFAGDDVSETLASVLAREPDWTALPTAIAPAIRTLLRRCLDKDRRKRIGDIAAARFTIEEVGGLGSTAFVSDAEVQPRIDAAVEIARAQLRRVMRLRVAATGVTAVLGTGAIVGVGVWFVMRTPVPNIVRTEIATAGVTSLNIQGGVPDIAITPDGSRIIYRGQNQLLVRALDQLTPLALTGLGAPRDPFVSPDGQWIGFFDGVFLKKVAVTGGAPVTVLSTTNTPRSGTWGEDGTIVYAGAPLTPLYRVSAAGGQPTALPPTDRNDGSGSSYLWPEFLPGGQALLVTIIEAGTGGNLNQAQIAVLDLRTNTLTVLLRGGTHAHYVSPGYLVYDVGGALYAVGFDLVRLRLVGTPVPVADGVFTTAFGGMDAVVAGNGTLVYVPGSAVQLGGIQRSLVWVGRDGREEPVANVPLRTYVYPRLSPDGTQIALDIRDQDQDIWIWSFQRQTLTRFTFDAALDAQPVWTPDGRRLIWISQRPLNIYWQASDGTGTRERLTSGSFEQRPSTVTPDGTRLLFAEDNTPGVATGTSRDLFVLPLTGDRKPTRLMQTTFDERNGEVSPDGRWLAYQSNESGQFQIFVRPFPAVDTGRWQLSSAGGQQPEWARNGRELFYLGSDGALMTVSVTTTSGSGGFTASTPVKLLEPRYYTAAGENNLGRTYDVSPDGRRFLMIKDVGNDQATVQRNLVVVQHFDEMLNRLVPTK
jgi:serine/threonine-protein kinase